jgi:hypothetical protein
MRQYLSFIFVGIAVFAIACKKDTAITLPEAKRAYIHVFNTLPEQVDVVVSAGPTASVVSAGQDFKQSFPSEGYADLLVRQGDSSYQTRFKVLRHSDQSVLFDSVFPAKTDVKTSIFLLPSNDRCQLAAKQDNFTTPTGNMANVQFVNLHPTIPSAALLSDTTIKITGLTPLNNSSFATYPARQYDSLKFYSETSNTMVGLIEGFTLRARHTYTFYLTRDGNNNPVVGYILME